MRERLSPTGAITGCRPAGELALVTGGQFSAGNRAFIVRHIALEAAAAGSVELPRNGSGIISGTIARAIDVELKLLVAAMPVRGLGCGR